MDPDIGSSSTANRPRIPRAIWMLGLVSLFTDMGSELVHGLLPLLLAGTLGASALAIGLIEGAAEATVLVTKVFSGYLSDALGRRKPLVLLGYGLAAASKPLFPLAAGFAQSQAKTTGQTVITATANAATTTKTSTTNLCVYPPDVPDAERVCPLPTTP